MARTKATAARDRRTRRRRRRVVVGVAVVAIVGAGAGTAWALQGSDGTQYRVAAVTRSTVAQTVDADGTLAAKQIATPAFATDGTVTSVGVAVGDTVRAGQTLATIDPADLDAAVTSAQNTVAQAKQKLTDDEDGTSTATSTTGIGSTGTGTGTGSGSAGTATTTSARTSTTTTTTTATTTSAHTAVLLTATRSTATPPASGSDSVTALRKQVEADATALVAAVSTQTAAITSACVATAETDGTEVTAAPDADGAITGVVGSQAAVVSLRQGTDTVQTADAGTPIAAGGSYSFTGLTAGQTYTVDVARIAVIDNSTCTAAITSANATTSTVSTAAKTFSTAMAALQKALTSSTTTGSGSGSTGGSGTGTGSTGGSGTGTGSTAGGTKSGTPTGTGSTTGTRSGSAATGSSTGTSTGSTSTGSTSSGTSSTTVTAEQLVADRRAITAAQADLAVAKQRRLGATLTSPISGKVAAVAITKGSTSSSSDTITVVGTGALSVDVSIPLSKIDLVKVGQTAAVTVDGRTASVPAKVTYVGVTNSSDSTGSSSAYTVTVQLDAQSGSLYDGMGAAVSIDVGSVRGAVTVPISAVHTTGTRSIVELYSSGKVTAQSVTLGLVGADTVQVTKGLSVGQQIVLAEVSAAVPSTSTTTGRTGRSLTGLTGGTGGGFTGGTGSAGGGFGGPPGGR